MLDRLSMKSLCKRNQLTGDISGVILPCTEKELNEAEEEEWVEKEDEDSTGVLVSSCMES